MSRPLRGGLSVALLVLIPLLAVAGSDDLRAALDFTTGVLSLVALTATVAWGLLATDRVFLSSRQRLLAQGIHRATAVASLGFLLLHATVKVALGHVALVGALVPFGLGVRGTAGLIGFGSLAGLLMVVSATTGALRSPLSGGRFASRWRTLHGLAYPAWCAALIHGLYAGRAASAWAVVMYGLCLLAVAAALCLRMLPPAARRRTAARITALISPGTLPAEPDPDPLPAPPAGTPGRFESAWQEPDREVRGTPVRARTLSAPSPPLYEAPPPHEAPPLYEAPPRSSERLGGIPPATEVPATAPGFAAAYRAVSRSAEPAPVHPDSHWPTPSPAPPTRSDRIAEPLPGPFYPPSAGEPWHAPAGDRP